jgi:hypothetical protein
MGQDSIHETFNKYFGHVVAFLIPGFVGIWGMSYAIPTIRSWLLPHEMSNATIPGMFYVLVGSLGVGMTISAARWMIVDSFHHITGLERPELNFANLKGCLSEFEAINEHHYRYYQFYANTFLAILVAYLSRMYFGKVNPLYEPVMLSGVAFACVVLFFASRHSLERFYTSVLSIVN